MVSCVIRVQTGIQELRKTFFTNKEGFMMRDNISMTRLARCGTVLFSVVLGLLLFVSSPASGVPIQEFTIPTPMSMPMTIAPGPDGNLWFTEECGNKVGRITPDGAISEYPLPGSPLQFIPYDCIKDNNGSDGRGLHGIAQGQDDKLWIADSINSIIWKMNKDGVLIGKYNVDQCPMPGEGAIQPIFNGYGPHGLTAGPDIPGPDGTPVHTIWFTHLSCNYIGVISTDTGEMIRKFIIPTHGCSTTTGDTCGTYLSSSVAHITADPNGAIWFTEHGNVGFMVNKIGKIMPGPLCAGNQKYSDPPSPCITEYLVSDPTTSLGLYEIAAGIDGSIWFTERTNKTIAKMEIGTSGTPTFTTYPRPFDPQQLSNPAGIAVDPDNGNIWFTEQLSATIGVIPNTPNGLIEKFQIPSAGTGFHITVGPDGNLWFTELNPASRIGKVRTRIAYIYDSDNPSDKNDFSSFLANNFYKVDPVPLKIGAETYDFSRDQAIIIGADTGHDGGYGYGWVWSGSDTAKSNIQGAGKPVIGIWLGGASYFSQVGGLAIDYEQSWIESANWGEVAVVNGADSVWSSPDTVLSIPPSGGVFRIYDRGTMKYIAADNPTVIPGVTRIAKQSGDAEHYPIITQTAANRTYALWGYPDGPSYMSLAGQTLFANLLDKVEHIMYSSDVFVSQSKVQYSLAPGMTITFDNVTQPGRASIITKESYIGEVGDVSIPGGKTYDISFTGTFVPYVYICISYNETDVQNEGSLRFMHKGASGWVDITSSRDSVNNIICGMTSSFSVFAVTELLPPAISFVDTCPVTVMLNSAATIYVLVTDNFSGVAGQSVPNGFSALDTSAAGQKTFTVTARNNAGLEATAACVYRVIYDFAGTGGFHAPVSNPPVLNIAKAGSTIPIKWQLPDGKGGFISDLGAVTSVTVQQVNCANISAALTDPMATTATGNTGLRYDFTDNQYVYNWKTLKSWLGNCFELTLSLNDGNRYPVYFKFK
jgi:streptogramin lyase